MKTRSVLISWIGWQNALVQQDVVKLRRDETPELVVAWFSAKPKVAKIVGWRWW